MCGIAGILRFNSKRVELQEIKNLTDPIAHRGPNGEGAWINKSENIGLGHRRLSVLDLTDNASQPMHYADGRLSVVYNGEIFNFAELREELIHKGYQFKSDSDTEVLLGAYHFWGKDCLHKFNGFWAFALWDELNQELWLARDRFGIKPLHYMNQPGKQFIFGSETLQFKNIDGYKRQPDDDMISYNIQHSWGIEGLGKTIFKGIEQIRPGHYIVVKPNAKIQQVKWWETADHLVDVPGSYDDQVDTFKELFHDAVKLRLRSDVNIASALSGGLDSSSVFATIRSIAKTKEKCYRVPNEWQRAFVAIFPGTEQDERMYADEVLKYVNGEAIYVDCTKDYKDLQSKLMLSIREHDSINATPMFIIDSLYASMKRHNITVSMDGHGVDEMMYGYPYNVLNAYGHQLHNPGYAGEIKNIYLGMLPPDEQLHYLKKMKFHNRAYRFAQRKARGLMSKFSQPGLKDKWFHSDLRNRIDLPNPVISERFKGSEAQLYSDFHFTTLPTILRNFDRGAMRNSIEIRMPFLDYRLVTYVFSLPMASKLGNGFTKRILRDAMKVVLPDFVRTRQLKTGFNAPLKTWFQQELKSFILDEVSSTEFISSTIWDGRMIRDQVIAKTKSGEWTMEECFKFWTVLNAHLLFKN